MPFRSSKVQSKIMEPADSRPSLDISFLNLPSPFHASPQNSYSPLTSPLSPSTLNHPKHSPPASCSKHPWQASPSSSQHQINNHTQLNKRTTPWWPIPSTPKAKLNHRKHLDQIRGTETEEVEFQEGLLDQDMVSMQMQVEHHVLERRLRRRMIMELFALCTLLLFLLGVVVVCVRTGGNMRMDDGEGQADVEVMR